MSGKADLDYRNLLQEVERALAGEDPLARAVEVLQRVPHYSWVGIYLLEGEELVLGPWKGPAATEHVRIPIGVGICGAAAKTGRTEVVDDVSSDPRYLACFPSTRAEMVVPILDGGRVLGEIDVDSDLPAAFSERDREFLEEVARLLAPRIKEGR